MSIDSAVDGISVDDLNVSYGAVRALRDVSVHIKPGRICGLVGMNGAGKSTLFKSLMGVIPIHSGRLSFLGEPSVKARRAGMIGYVPQHDDIDTTFPLSVQDVVMLGRYGYQNWVRHPRAVDREAVAEAIERVELTGLAKRQIGQLSGGQRKRVFVARALAQHARVLLLDEPFAGVDKRSEATIVSVLHDLVADGATILVATHDLHSLPALCAESVLINRTVLMHGETKTVLEPQNLARAFDLSADEAREVIR
ncbi:metal ABC transporter ATP-binding protein [Pseudoclavibacter sp. CFCC 13796]|uniref:metal ABC transporter ATP-binding protein n=1 Tax=Pseudoclavibacter sp. CFCC 13796 TaxID=2615179 RepID=UPI001CE49366|nr:metal ABC transporter ATP-binding protein [Pseudoclavibacter sp. CFCC 13796]